MNQFSEKSLAKLKTCHEDIQTICYEAIKIIDFTILEGHRGQEDQDRAFNEGKSEKKWPDSKHNELPSVAFDAAPCPVDWNDLKRFYYFAGILIGVSERLISEGKIKHKLKFGGDWDRDNDFKDNKFNDLPHFELIEV
jgi:peptidoglycan LD-endopeptidase CwlK